MKNKKIAFLSTGIARQIPSGKVNIDLIRNLTKDNSITIYGIEIEDELKDLAECKQLWFIPRKPILLRYILTFFYYKLLFLVTNRFKSYDLVISVENCSPKAHIAQFHFCHKAALELKEKNILTYKGFRSPYYSLLHRFGAYCDQIVLRNKKLKRYICVSEGLKEEIKRYYNPARSGYVINNFISPDTDNRNAPVSKAEIREKYQLIPDDLVAVIIAQGDWERKGIRYVYEAIKLLENQAPDIYYKLKLIIVGGGPLKEYEALGKAMGIDHKLIFTGFSKNVPELLKVSDFFVLPTAYEAMSLVVLEAAAAGLPLLVTKVNGVQEVLKEDFNGYFIKRDGVDICEKIIKLMTEKEIFVQSASYAEELKKRFGLEMYIEKYRSLLSSLI